MKPGKFDALIFDFDGVLVESVDVKTRAFAALYAQYGSEVVKQVVSYHLEHGGVSRFEKFGHFHRTFLGKSLSDEEEAGLGERFSRLVEDEVVTSAYVEGAKEFLDTYYQTIPMFVASGTPDAELKRIVARRGMAHYFVSVHGTPASKGEILRGIVERHGYRRERVLMVGDATTDYQGALEAGVQFLARAVENPGPFPVGTPVLPDLTGLPAFLWN